MGGEVSVCKAGRDAVGHDGDHGRHADPDFAAVVKGGEHDRLGRHLGVVDRRHRLGAAAHFVERPVELRRVHRRQVDHAQFDRATVMDEFAAETVGKPLDRGFRAAIGRLQRHRAVGEGGADIDDGALIAPFHGAQGGHDTVHGAQVSRLGRALEFGRRDIRNRRENRRHRVVHPDIDRAQRGLDGIGGVVDGFGIGHVGRGDAGANPQRPQFGGGGFQPVAIAPDQTDVAAGVGELLRGSAADAGAGAGDDDNFAHDDSP